MTTRSKNKGAGLFGVFDAIFLSILAVAVTVLLSSCSAVDDRSASSSTSASSTSATVDATASAEKYDITLTATSPEGPNAIDFTQQIAVAEGTTVLEALQATELDVTVVDGPYGAYVEAIGGIANEGTSGWTYTVNDEQIQVSAGEAPVNAGDVVKWSYIDMAA